MLAPRKNLWTTPQHAMTRALELLQPQAEDVVFDIGSGDGEFLLLSSTQSNAKQIIGVEIEEERATKAKEMLFSNHIDEDRVSIIVGNALEQSYAAGTCFFMYLIPRGLRLILPLLKSIDHPIRVVSFMNPLPDIEPVKSEKISPPQHPEAQWPLFYYELSPTSLPSNKSD
jgi:16S rRNA A1518/A1519 N6-dimethyltransferase RsmA/KsgA/DIM1 with predicted DNA glycosylase/AP lyase activity